MYILKVAKLTIYNLIKDNCLRYSAALSFYALFSIAPIIFLSIYIAGLWVSDIDLQKQITNQFSQLIGERGAKGIELLMSTLKHEEQNSFQLIFGVIVLIFSATNIFVQTQLAFNEIYSVQAKKDAGVLKVIIDRLISFGVVLSLGFIFIVSLVLDSVVYGLNTYLTISLNETSIIISVIIQYVLLFVLIMGVIYSLFHFLPDVIIPMKCKLFASITVTLLLLFGKYFIGIFINKSQLGELGGASASVIILMLWVYYSSIILFIGAETIKAMAELGSINLVPRRYATYFNITEITS